MNDYFDYLESTTSDNLQDALADCGFPVEPTSSFARGFSAGYAIGAAASPFDSARENILNALDTLGDIELTAYVSGGYLCGVDWSPSDDEYSSDMLLSIRTGGKNHTDYFSLSFENYGSGIFLESSGNHSARGGTFTDSTYMEADGTLVFEWECSYAPKRSGNNFSASLHVPAAYPEVLLSLDGRIESDSKLMSGRDVAIAAMLGAEEFGFGTGPLVAMGCVMMRVCNLDTCPMGICTQNPELRKKFIGKPEYVMNFMKFMAQELREYMAKLGVRTVDELVGRTDLLKVRPAPAGSRASEMDLSGLLKNPLVENTNVHFDPKAVYDFKLEQTPDMKVLMKKFKKSFDMAEPKPMTVQMEVGNTDRTFGSIFGSEITAKFGNTLPDDTFRVVCTGYGGQSFGAFIPKGLTLELIGDSNDYLGKGLSGGKIIVYPPKNVTYDRSENILIGNVAFYGATGGKAFINGVAGERFCVRNSGAVAVVEGVGDHGCEYMTGGTVVVLGKTGKNFAAGMSGGIAYVLDEDWDFYQRVNKDMVTLESVEHKYDVSLLKDLIREHVEATGSPRGKEILENFGEYLPKFKKVLPHDYDKMLRLIAKMEEKGEDSEQAQIEAFYAMKNGK